MASKIRSQAKRIIKLEKELMQKEKSVSVRSSSRPTAHQLEEREEEVRYFKKKNSMLN